MQIQRHGMGYGLRKEKEIILICHINWWVGEVAALLKIGTERYMFDGMLLRIKIEMYLSAKMVMIY